MSITYDIGCQDCKESLWIGQYSFRKGIIYSNEKKTMSNLEVFLYKHAGHNLIFTCDELLTGYKELQDDNRQVK